MCAGCDVFLCLSAADVFKIGIVIGMAGGLLLPVVLVVFSALVRKRGEKTS